MTPRRPLKFADVDGGMEALHPPRTMSPKELGDTVAHFVWESFSDFLVAPEMAELLAALELEVDGGVPPERETGELLIFHLWAHTRAIQLSFVRRGPEEQVREGLDALHRAVFEDMVENGTPEAQLPVFEQRVSARYAEYHAAAADSDEALGKAAAAHLGSEAPSPEAARILMERAVEVANPLRDFLADVDLE